MKSKIVTDNDEKDPDYFNLNTNIHELCSCPRQYNR